MSQPAEDTLRSGPFSQAEVAAVIDRLAGAACPFQVVSIGHDVLRGTIVLGVLADDVDIAREHVRSHDLAVVGDVPVPIVVTAGEPTTPV